MESEYATIISNVTLHERVKIVMQYTSTALYNYSHKKMTRNQLHNKTLVYQEY